MTTPVTHLTTLTPIRAGRSSHLRAAIGRLPTGHRSPFEAVPGTHFARLVVLDHLGADGHGGRRIDLASPRLMFAVNCDGDAPAYVTQMCKSLGDVTDVVWADCEGYPGAAEPARFARWLCSHAVAPILPFATVDAPVEQVLSGLDARRRMAEFAVSAQGLDPHALRARWREEFGW